MVWWCLYVRPGLRPPVFHIFLQHALTYWAEILHVTFCYCTSDQVRVTSICVNFCGSYAPFAIRILEIHSFPYFSLTCFDILSWNFAYDLFYCTTDQVRVLSICVNFCGSYAPFGTQNTENTAFRTFLLHALTYWAEILHMTLFYCTTDKLRVMSICVNFCGSYAPFVT